MFPQEYLDEDEVIEKTFVDFDWNFVEENMITPAATEDADAQGSRVASNSRSSSRGGGSPMETEINSGVEFGKDTISLSLSPPTRYITVQ